MMTEGPLDRRGFAHGPQAYEIMKELERTAHQQFVSKNLSNANLLSFEEEELMKRYYHSRINDICQFFSELFPYPQDKTPFTSIPSERAVPPTLGCIAHYFLSLFFVRHSVMQVDGKHLMLATILVASKCVHLHWEMPVIVDSIPNVDVDLLMRMETKLLQALNFDINYQSPSQAFLGLLLQSSPHTDQSIELWNRGTHLLDQLAATEAPLVMSASQLATAVLEILLIDPSVSFADSNQIKETGNQWAVSFVKEKLGSNQTNAFDMNHIKALDRRIKDIYVSL